MCAKGHSMTIASRFRFDHEAGDSLHDTVRLERFRAMGLELGADVVVWQCPTCDCVEAIFTDPAKEPAP